MPHNGFDTSETVYDLLTLNADGSEHSYSAFNATTLEKIQEHRSRAAAPGAWRRTS